MKKFLILGLFVCALPLWGENHFKGEDFDNQSEIIVRGAGESSRCQAVRIAPKWFLTAAHCVSPQCDKACDIQVNLLQGDVYAAARVHHHENTHKRVWVQSSHEDDKLKSAGSDVALFFFDPAKSDYSFELPALNKKMGWKEFTKWLKQTGHSEYWDTLQGSCAKLYTIPNAIDQRVKQEIAVPDIAAGTWTSGTGFYYFNSLQHYIGPDIGVSHGMSGSGVIVPGGGIIGVVVSSLTQEDSHPSAEMLESGPGGYFLFAPINQKNRDFIESVLNGSGISSPGKMPEIVTAGPGIVIPTDAKLEDVFGGFAVLSNEGLF